MTFNRLRLIGFLGKDGARKITSNGTPFTLLSVATKHSWKDQVGEWHHAIRDPRMDQLRACWNPCRQAWKLQPRRPSRVSRAGARPRSIPICLHLLRSTSSDTQ